MPFSMTIECNWKLAATSIDPPIRRSGVVPVFFIVMYPIAVEAPFGVVRDHGPIISREPAL
jgi:hypothetical protein